VTGDPRRAERLWTLAIRHPAWHAWADDDGWHAWRRDSLLSAVPPDDRTLHEADYQDFTRLLSREDGTELALAGRPS